MDVKHNSDHVKRDAGRPVLGSIEVNDPSYEALGLKRRPDGPTKYLQQYEGGVRVPHRQPAILRAHPCRTWPSALRPVRWQMPRANARAC